MYMEMFIIKLFLYEFQNICTKINLFSVLFFIAFEKPSYTNVISYTNCLTEINMFPYPISAKVHPTHYLRVSSVYQICENLEM